MRNLDSTLACAAPSARVCQTIESFKNFDRAQVDVLEPADKIIINSSNYRISRQCPSPPCYPKQKRLERKDGSCPADKIAKQQLKKSKKVALCNKRFCFLCQISRNLSKTFYNYINSRADRRRLENKKCSPQCITCNKTFKSHGHLPHHLNSPAHLKVATKLHQ